MKFMFSMLVLAATAQVHSAPPSAAVAYCCLAARPVITSVKWQQLPTNVINSQDDYADGFDATYYFAAGGKDIGYAKREDAEAIIYDGKLYPLGRERLLDGFVFIPSEFEPFRAEWGVVTDRSGRFLCISFPFSELGMSGSFQKFRSAYLLPIDRGKARNLYFASANIEQFKPPRGPLRTGALFLNVRANLIKAGWRPVRLGDADAAGTETLRTRKRIPEAEACSMDRGSLCLFNYRKGYQCLQVQTVGESTHKMHVVTWDSQCPSDVGVRRAIQHAG